MKKKRVHSLKDNMLVPNIGFKNIGSKTDRIKGEIDKSITIVGNFNTSISISERTVVR